MFCGRQTDVVEAFLNERGVMKGNAFVDSELEALKKMYVWREGRLMGWLKRNTFEHLPNTTREAVVWVVLGRSGVKVTRRDVVWAGKLLRVLEGMRLSCGRSRLGDKQVALCGGGGGGGLKRNNLGLWMKMQLRAYDTRRLPARYRHVLEELGREPVWDAFN